MWIDRISAIVKKKKKKKKKKIGLIPPVVVQWKGASRDEICIYVGLYPQCALV